MNLIWHIAAKDLRRTGSAALVWAVSVVGFALWFAFAAHVSPNFIVSRFSGEEVFASVIRTVQLVLALLIAGSAVLEDRLVGTDAFWLTRPIRRGQLLAAKAVSSIVLFIVLPLLGMTPLWFGLGFTPGQVCLAILDHTVVLVLVLAFALMIGGLSSGLGNFLFLAIIVFMLHVMCGAFAPTRGLTEVQSMAVRQTRNMIIQYAVVPALVLVVVHQYFTRNRTRSLAILAGVLLCTLIVRLAWPWAIVTVPEKTIAPSAATLQSTPVFSDPAGQILGEMPLKAGSSFRHRSYRTQVVEIERSRPNHPVEVVLRESMAFLAMQHGFGPMQSTTLLRAQTVKDHFFLKIPGETNPVWLPLDDAGFATYSSVAVAVRKLVLPTTLTHEQLENATLVKVRFTETPTVGAPAAGDKNP